MRAAGARLLRWHRSFYYFLLLEPVDFLQSIFLGVLAGGSQSYDSLIMFRFDTHVTQKKTLKKSSEVLLSSVKTGDVLTHVGRDNQRIAYLF